MTDDHVPTGYRELTERTVYADGYPLAPWEAGTDRQTEPASVMPPADDDTEPADITDDDKQTAERITALGQTDAFGQLRGFT